MIDKNVYIIVAVDEKNGIGKGGKLPWKLKKDMQFFKDTTSETFESEAKNMVVMGRKTWESIDPKYRPLEGRKNVVLSQNQSYKADGAEVCYSLGGALKKAELDEKIENVFIIGGGKIFELALPIANGIYLTRIEKTFDCDTFFPEFAEFYGNTPESLGSEKESGIKYDFNFYAKIPDLI